MEFFVRVEDAFVLERRAESLRRHVGLGKLGETWGGLCVRVSIGGHRWMGTAGNKSNKLSRDWQAGGPLVT